MGEPVRATEIDEHAKVGDRGDGTFADLAFLEVVKDLVLLLLTEIRHGGAFGEDDAVPLAGQLHDFELDRLTDEVGELVDGIRIVAADAIDLGERDKGVDAFDVDEDAAAIVAGDGSFENLVVGVADGEDIPALFAAGAVERDDGVTFGGGRLEDHHLDGVSRLELGRAIGAQ